MCRRGKRAKADERERVYGSVYSCHPDHLAGVVDVSSSTLNAGADGSEIDDLTVPPKGTMTRREPAYRIDLTILRAPGNPPPCVDRACAAASLRRRSG